METVKGIEARIMEVKGEVFDIMVQIEMGERAKNAKLNELNALDAELRQAKATQPKSE